jgi:alkylation response protein AidB-like acyl-CoA dehydrogenase
MSPLNVPVPAYLADEEFAIFRNSVGKFLDEIVDVCLQLHGGYGYMDEYPIARLFKDARVARIYGGANEIMKLLIARTL